MRWSHQVQLGEAREEDRGYTSMLPVPLAPGSYMVEVWCRPGADGVMELNRAVPVKVTRGIASVRVEPER